MNELADANPVDRINQLRAKIAAGEEISREESAEAVRLLRSRRLQSVTPTTKSNLPTDLADLFKK
jgi:hypothetical protein